MKPAAVLAIPLLLLSGGLARAEWELVAPMPTSRAFHAASVAADRWYVAGGYADDQAFPTEVDVYDPKSGRWTALTGKLAVGRSFGIAMTNPASGDVLFPGGESPSLTGYDVCEFGGADGIFGGPAMHHGRFTHAGAFAAGRFIVTGGWDENGAKRLDDAETLDEGEAGWRVAGTMPSGSRTGHTMTALANGRDVLVIGGCQMDHAMTAVDLYRADTGEWSVVAPMKVPRCLPRSVLLADGRVLVSGGSSVTGTGLQSSAEIYDPAADRWTLVAPMSDKRFYHGLALLPDGSVIAVAGSNDYLNGEIGALRSAEVYDPATNVWSPVPPLHDRRQWPTLAVLSDGVYVAGGAWGEYPATGNPIIQVHVLASVERLSWADLGIAPPNPDAGSLDGAPRDDGGSDTDGGVPDAPSVADSATDSAQPGTARGCSCQSTASGGSGSAANLIAASALLALVLRRQRGKRGGAPGSS